MNDALIDIGQSLLKKCAIHPERGFLPWTDPITRLPAQFNLWEELAQQLPKLLVLGKVRQVIDEMPLLDTAQLEDEDQLNRAMLLLSYFGHAYVFSETPPAHILPANVAVPWYNVAQALGRPPVLSYASHALYNWRRLAADGPIDLENLVRLENFLGGMDEDWFVLVHIAIEAKAGPGLHAIVGAQDAVAVSDSDQVVQKLDMVARTLEQMLETLKRMPEKCDPYIYYTRVRPFIFGWKDNPALPGGVIYKGVEAYHGQPQTFRGETGAQSSIIPAFDNAFGLYSESDPLKDHLIALQDYMPPLHREFVVAMSKRPSIRHFVQKHHSAHPLLATKYNECVDLIRQFREKHLEYAGVYIHAQSQRVNSNPIDVGTGGTPFIQYLKQHARDLKNYFID